MHVRADSLDEEVRVTVDAATAIANELVRSDDDRPGRDRDCPPGDEAGDEVLRSILVDHDFLRARGASGDEFAELADRCRSIGRFVRSLPDAGLAESVDALNHQLQACAIAPSLSAHDGFALHIHWTTATSPFAHQVAVDLLMALAQTLCDHGTERFGRCAAKGCERIFFDTTKNRSRRFCDDPRCASRTHTAAHRARQSPS